MQPRAMLKLTALVATSVLMASSTLYAAGNNGKGGKGNNRDNDRNSSVLWPDHENACAVGNHPPQGANCTNRDDQR
jgi:hypothetical protein